MTRKNLEENQNQEDVTANEVVPSEVSTSTKVVLENGKEVDFGKRNVMVMEQADCEPGKVGIIFQLITGRVFPCIVDIGNAPEPASALISRGIKSYVGDYVAGVYRNKDGETFPDDFNIAVEEAITQIATNQLVSRGSSTGESIRGKGDLIRALVESRAEANAKAVAEGREAVYNESWEDAKKTILASSEEDNKARKVVFAVKIATYEAERAAAKKAKLEKNLQESDIQGLL